MLGAAGRATNYVPGVIHAAGALGGPWLLGAFLAGALSRSRSGGALAGELVVRELLRTSGWAGA